MQAEHHLRGCRTSRLGEQRFIYRLISFIINVFIFTSPCFLPIGISCQGSTWTGSPQRWMEPHTIKPDPGGVVFCALCDITPAGLNATLEVSLCTNKKSHIWTFPHK